MTNTNDISAKDIARKTARLARLRIPESELDVLAPQLEKILGLFEELQEVDTDAVEPLANVVGETLTLRKDEVTDGGYPEKVLSNAPDSTQGFYAVPKVVE